MKPHRIAYFIGRRAVGKTQCCRHILYHLKDKVDFGLFMTPTEDSASNFRTFAPESWIYDSFDQGKLEEMLSMQRQLSRTNKQRNLMCVLDDCMYDKKVLKGTAIRDLHMNGRHLKCQFINCVQYLMDIGPELRSQIDYVFVFKEPIYANQVKLWKFFFGIFPNFNDFKTVLERCTSNYGVLVLDNTQPSMEISDCLFWFRASLDIPKFRLGKEIFWQLSEKHTKTPKQRQRDEMERTEVARLEAAGSKKKDRVTAVQRQDRHGRVLKEDRGETVTLLA